MYSAKAMGPLSILLLSLFLIGANSQDPFKGLPTREEFDFQVTDDSGTTYRWAAKAFGAMTANTPIEREIRLANHLVQAAINISEPGQVKIYIEAIENAWQKAADLSMNMDRIEIGLGLARYYWSTDKFEKAEAMFKRTIAEAQLFHDHSVLLQVIIDQTFPRALNSCSLTGML